MDTQTTKPGEVAAAPQFDADALYIPPFRERRVIDPDTGRWSYEPLERNLAPSGVRLLDAYLRRLAAGGFYSSKAVAAELGTTTADLSVFCRLLTGRSSGELFHRFMLRMADDLLRYTDLTTGEVALRCGANTAQNLSRVFRRERGFLPRMRRLELRREGDLGRFRP